MKFLSAQGKHDKSTAELKQRTEALAKKKEHTTKQHSLLEQKTKEVEEFRKKKAVDDVGLLPSNLPRFDLVSQRERQAKINALAQNTTGI